MVEVDADDRRGERLRHVGRVEPAAEPDLEHRDVDAPPPEVRERRGRQHLEEGGVSLEHAAAHERGRRVAHVAHRAREVALADGVAVHRDPLVDPDEVRRRVAPRAEPRRAQHRVAVGRDRALAVRAGDQQRGIRALGVAHLRHERTHRLEAELDPETDALGEVQPGDAVSGETDHRGRITDNGTDSP